MPKANIVAADVRAIIDWPKGHSLSVTATEHGYNTIYIAPHEPIEDEPEPEADTMVGRTLTADDPEPPEGTLVTRQDAAYVHYYSGWRSTFGTGIRLAWSSVTLDPVTVLRWGWGE